MIGIEEKRSGTFLLTLEGCVDYAASPQVRKALGELFEKDAKQIIVDLTRVHYIDSSGIATLVERLKQSGRKKVRLTLAGMSASLEAYFDLANLKDVFEMVAGVEQALAADN